MLAAGRGRTGCVGDRPGQLDIPDMSAIFVAGNSDSFIVTCLVFAGFVSCCFFICSPVSSVRCGFLITFPVSFVFLLVCRCFILKALQRVGEAAGGGATAAPPHSCPSLRCTPAISPECRAVALFGTSSVVAAGSAISAAAAIPDQGGEVGGVVGEVGGVVGEAGGVVGEVGGVVGEVGIRRC